MKLQTDEDVPILGSLRACSTTTATTRPAPAPSSARSACSRRPAARPGRGMQRRRRSYRPSSRPTPVPADRRLATRDLTPEERRAALEAVLTCEPRSGTTTATQEARRTAARALLLVRVEVCAARTRPRRPDRGMTVRTLTRRRPPPSTVWNTYM